MTTEVVPRRSILDYDRYTTFLKAGRLLLSQICEAAIFVGVASGVAIDVEATVDLIVDFD
jgi:hypothetical protein